MEKRKRKNVKLTALDKELIKASLALPTIDQRWQYYKENIEKAGLPLRTYVSWFVTMRKMVRGGEAAFSVSAPNDGLFRYTYCSASLGGIF